jgi:DNA-nicking Smr family endonuclease
MAISDDDADIFKNTMHGVKPLKDTNKISAPKPKRVRRKKHQQESDEDQLFLSDHCAEDITHEQFLCYAKPGVQPKYFRQLKQGKIAIEADLDLHGCTIDDARKIFSEFMLSSQKHGLRCVRVVHGKGYRAQTKIPLMKSKVYTWLKQMPNILAFCSCVPKDGGTGALYVLLAREG